MIALFITFISALNQSHYRQCKDSPFCARNRFIEPRTWSSDPGQATLIDSVFTLPLLDETYQNKLIFHLTFHEGNIIHFKISPVSESFKRYDCSSEPSVVNSTVLETRQEINEEKNDTHIILTVGESSAVIQTNPFQFTIYENGNPKIEINPDLKAIFETNINKEKFPELYQNATFDNYNETLINGPASVAMTFKYFTSNDEGIKFNGIPLHSLDSNLPSTVIRGEPTTDPIRLFNTDTNEFLSDSVVSLYGSIPYLIGHSGAQSIGLFWCNPSETWVDIDNGNTSARFISETGYIDCYAFYGSHKNVIKSYTSITGRSPLPQLFSLGFHQSRWSYKSTKEVKSVSRRLDKELIPHDSIWLDLDHTDNKKYFTFEPNNFKNIKKLLKEFKTENRYLVALVDPHLKVERDYQIYYEAKDNSYFVKGTNRRDYIADCWPGRSGFVDFFNPDASEWFSNLYKYDNYRKTDTNLFIWNDMNEPSIMKVPESTLPRDCVHYGKIENRAVHNLYGQMMIKSTFNGLLNRNEDKNERPFILTRSFFAGSQKYAFTWSGDNAADWDHLRNSISMTITLGVCGYPFSGSDIGGFFRSPDQELLLRWYQVGAYCYPFFRSHCHHLSEHREPYVLKSEYQDGVKNAINTRYQLLPLWYTLSYQTSLDGQPIVRPLWWEFDDAEVQEIETQVMVGDSLLVIPSLSPSESSIHAYIPRARWYEYRSLKELTKSGEVVNIPYEKLDIPVLIKGGKVIFTKPTVKKTSMATINDSFNLIVAVDSQNKASGEIYADDGHTYDYTNNDAMIYRKVEFDGKTMKSIEIKPSNKNSEFIQNYDAPIELISITGLDKLPTSVKNQNGAEVQMTDSDGVLQLHVYLYMKDDWTLEFEY